MNQNREIGSESGAAAGMRAFGTGLFDYAGLYPPASLSLPAAVAAYLEHRRGPTNWMLGRFVIHATKLAELGRILGRDEQLTLSVLVASRTAADEYGRILDADLKNTATFLSDRSSPTTWSAETSAPVKSIESLNPGGFILEIEATLQTHRLFPDRVFIEVPVDLSTDALRVWGNAIASANQSSSTKWALKARCGGILASHVPSATALANFLTVCAAVDAPFKATAGLHHPIRGQYYTEDVPMHGFLNVFGAATFVRAGLIPPKTVVGLLDETGGGAFSLDANGFRWRSYSASVAELAHVRERFALSIGSCSFTEPINDLVSLRIL